MRPLLRPLHLTARVVVVALAALVWGVPAGHAEPVVVQAKFQADRELLASLDRELWQPLMAAYDANELENYLAAFAPEALLANGNLPSLSPLTEHRPALERRFLVRRNRVGQFRMEYRFTERAVYREWSSERGIMAETDPANGTTYHEFHYFSRKVAGVWRITIAYTKRLPGEAAQAFAAAAAAGDNERF